MEECTFLNDLCGQAHIQTSTMVNSHIHICFQMRLIYYPFFLILIIYFIFG